MNTRIAFGLVTAAVAAVAGCGGAASNTAAKVTPQHANGATAADGTTSGDETPADSTEPSACRTSDLSIRIGRSEGAAGSIYEPLRFTNKGDATCTLSGYPGVSFVAPSSGDQVGAAATRNPQHPARTVTLAVGSSADAVVQVTNHSNYDPAQCKAAEVSGFRVYPPGNTEAAYVPFDEISTACSSNVTQLTVEAAIPAS